MRYIYIYIHLIKPGLHCWSICPSVVPFLNDLHVFFLNGSCWCCSCVQLVYLHMSLKVFTGRVPTLKYNNDKLRSFPVEWEQQICINPNLTVIWSVDQSRQISSWLFFSKCAYEVIYCTLLSLHFWNLLYGLPCTSARYNCHLFDFSGKLICGKREQKPPRMKVVSYNNFARKWPIMWSQIFVDVQNEHPLLCTINIAALKHSFLLCLL